MLYLYMATARIILDARRALADGLFPVKIRVANVKKWKFYGTLITMSEEDFEKLLKGKNLNEDLKNAKKKLEAVIKKAEDIIEKLEPFDFEVFNSRFLKKGNRSDLLFLLRDKAETFGEKEKYASQNLYNQSAAILEAYINHNRDASGSPLLTLPVSTVTTNWLYEFEKWALSVTYDKKLKGSDETVKVLKYNQTTLGMYLIRVRSIFNDIISARELSPEHYPFHKAENKNGYKIPQPINNKRPLDMDRIMELYDYVPINGGEQRAKDFFLFSYLSSGMNMVDIFKLKWQDIQNNQFTFIRKKTQAKTGGMNKITITLNDELREIIERQGSHKLGNDYIFDIIPPNASEKELLKETRIAISAINASIKRIAFKLGWEEKPSTYFARHAYSNNLMNSEVPLIFISKQLGHKDLKTTQNYLSSFTTDNAIKYQDNLLRKNDKTA